MKTLLISLFLIYALTTHAQIQANDLGRITIHAYVPSYEGIPTEATKLLQSKLSQVITANGVADNEYSVRFVLTAKVNIITKDIVAGPPQRISQKMEITFILGDIIADKVYSSITIPAIGIGTSLDKSYISAIKNINPRNPNIKEFIENGKRKVIDYYEMNCNQIIDEANKLSKMQNYDEAISLLLSVPDVCKECYDKCSLLASQTYDEMINAQGLFLLRQAQGAWSEQPNKEGAAKAIEYLSKINNSAERKKEQSVANQL